MIAFFVALLPIIGIFVLLFLFRQSSLRAGLFAYAVAVLITLFHSTFSLDFSSVMNATIQGLLISFIAAYVLTACHINRISMVVAIIKKTWLIAKPLRR
ncbi:lactate permease [Natribacillus halophilus]|uniref:Lactate permease n=2 Tax=Natribacillus halophilus TaxID=549003 RepID=A0A1G8M8P3_9BACI|nr:lactate permease [Natribacillus halophilus]